MTRDHILHRLFVNKDLRIDPVTSVVETLRHGKWHRLRQVSDQHDSGYRFVEVSFQGMKRKVGVHVLQWMQANGWVMCGAEDAPAYNTGIPDGYDVHHRPPQPPRPRRKNNALEQLSLLPSHVNQANGVECCF